MGHYHFPAVCYRADDRCVRPAEGAFASCNPRTQILAGSGALVAADPAGIAVAQFGWANLTTGKAAPARQSPADRLGFVLPICGTWQRIYWNAGKRWIRPGTGVTLCRRGDFWAKFALGALAGYPVYANPLDGSLICGYSAGAELTPWSTITSCGPGELAIISTWGNFQ